MKVTLLNKKILCTFVLAESLCVMSAVPVRAEDDFETNEEHYITLCSSENLSASNEKVCKKFNQYLKDKTDDLDTSINDLTSMMQDTQEKIDNTQAKLEELDQKIEENEKEISYLNASISKLQASIRKNEDKLKEEIYAMQSVYTTNYYIDYLFRSSDFDDFFSRLSSLADFTDYEQSLVNDIKEEKEELETQRNTLSEREKKLKSQSEQAKELQDKYVDLLTEQESQKAEQEAERDQVSEDQAKIDIALAMLAAGDTAASGELVAGESATGNKIAAIALTKLGCRYWWGAKGPNYFDCSGFVYWVFNQAGISRSYANSAALAHQGKSVKRSELQAGDIITFSYGSGVAHVAIYIGGGRIVHALGVGSGTTGQYASQCVKISNLSGYWSRYIHNCRRLY